MLMPRLCKSVDSAMSWHKHGYPGDTHAYASSCLAGVNLSDRVSMAPSVG